MKRALLIFKFVFAPTILIAQTSKQIDNETTFARLYGYVRYFHPSDEAASINWDKFALYGVQQVDNCTNRAELLSTLNGLFKPIAPSLKISYSEDGGVYNSADLIPNTLKNYKVIAWQHLGVGLISDKDAPYQSARTNRPIIYTPPSQKSISMSKIIDVKSYRGMSFILKGKSRFFKGNGKGYIWLGIGKKGRASSYFDNMDQTYSGKNEWIDFEIKGVIDTSAEELIFGGNLIGNGELDIDKVDLAVKGNTAWEHIYTRSFDKGITGEVNQGLLSDLPFKTNPDYLFRISEDEKFPGKKWGAIKSRNTKDTVTVEHAHFFKDLPQVGQLINKEIGSGLKIVMPIALYGNAHGTYPIADAAQLSDLNKKINYTGGQSENVKARFNRLADLVITFNVFQHFFPYFAQAHTDWLLDLRTALTSAYQDQSRDDFLKLLQALTAKLKDGHIVVYKEGINSNAYCPPIKWEWVEGKLLITGVLNDSSGLKIGDIVTAINGAIPEQYYKETEQYISAATPGWLEYRANTETLLGPKASPLQLTILKADGAKKEVTVRRNWSLYGYYLAMPHRDSIKVMENGIVYLNIATVSMKSINKVMPQLKKSRAIICDLRDNTTDNYSVNDFIGNLLTQKDTASHWLRIPQIIYPDQENRIGYQQEGFEMSSHSPHLAAKVIFIVDASDISWAESYISIIDHYKLATIVGQTTAGTNGDTNRLTLPDGYTIYFTGTNTVQLDGSLHHGVGTKPSIFIEKTVKGVRENRDEFLEKAISIANSF